MYYITKSDWEKIKAQHPDYCSKALTRHEHEGRVCNPGATLIFEHVHFEII